MSEDEEWEAARRKFLISTLSADVDGRLPDGRQLAFGGSTKFPPGYLPPSHRHALGSVSDGYERDQRRINAIRKTADDPFTVSVCRHWDEFAAADRGPPRGMLTRFYGHMANVDSGQKKAPSDGRLRDALIRGRRWPLQSV